MADTSGNPNDQIAKSRLQSIVLDYKKTKKLTKCGIIAIAVILILLLIFLTTGWGHYRTSLEAKKASTMATDGKNGKDGSTPYIGENGNWFIDGEDTGVSARGDSGALGDDGADGKDGLTPHIGANGNWFIGDMDTGIPATGGSGGGEGGGAGTGTTTPSGDGSFTVKLDPNQGNKSIAVSETRGFANPTDNLLTNGINNAWNITLSDIPAANVIDTEVGGSNNGHNYFAYTFFLKNTGTVALDYNELLSLTQNELDAVKALRFMLYRDGAPTIYASPAANGSKEPFACDEAFSGNVNLMTKDQTNLQPGQVVRYTVVIWFEGNDPECINDILGGSVKLTLGFKIL